MPSMFRVASLVLLAACGGCSSRPDAPALYPVRGTLTINDKPPIGATLILHPAEAEIDARGTKPTASVKPDGSFYVSTYADSDGAPAGEYSVSILWTAKPDSSDSWDRLGDAFSDPSSSGIKITVEPGENIVPPIALSGIAFVHEQPNSDVVDLDGIE